MRNALSLGLSKDRDDRQSHAWRLPHPVGGSTNDLEGMHECH